MEGPYTGQHAYMPRPSGQITDDGTESDGMYVTIYQGFLDLRGIKRECWELYRLPHDINRIWAWTVTKIR